MPDGPAREARDKHLKSRPYYSPPSKWDRKPIDVAPGGMDPMFEPYLLGYDVFEHVRALSRVLRRKLLMKRQTNRKLDEMLI
jgi:hypothetical protein